MNSPWISATGRATVAFACLAGLAALWGSPIAALASPTGDSTHLIQRTAPWQFPVGRWEWRSDSGTPILAQTEAVSMYAVALATKQRWRDVDVSMRFRALSGNIDASGGIVFRAIDERNYYVVRANCLEDNFRLYTVVGGVRRQIAGVTVPKPAMQQWQNVRVVVVDDQIQAYLNGKLLIEHHDTTFRDGYVGLWTKADSVTEFADMRAASPSAKHAGVTAVALTDLDD